MAVIGFFAVSAVKTEFAVRVRCSEPNNRVLIPAEAPITYSAHGLECLQHGRVLKRIFGVSEPVLPTLLPWTTGTCEFIRLLESDLSGLLVRFQRHYHTACRYFEGISMTEIDRDHKHQLDCDL